MATTATPSSPGSTLPYNLPSVVESIRSGWLSTVQSAAIVSSLLAAVEASLVAFFRDKDNYTSEQPDVRKAIVTLTMTSIVFSISATISALTLTDEFGEISGRASRNPIHTPNPIEKPGLDNRQILRYFGARKSTRCVIWLWLICLLAAGLCAIASIITNTVCEGTWTAIFPCIAGVTAVPPLLHLLF